MTRETILNTLIFLALPAVALAALVMDEPFTITLATRAAILALAAVGLNIALGLGGLVSLGHAVFFGLGGYAMGILASHAQSFVPIVDGWIVIEGTKSMPIIWLVAVLSSALVALIIGLLSLRTSGVYFIMITLAFGQMFYYFSISWPAYGGEDGLSIYVRNSFPGLNTLDPIQFFGLVFALLAGVLWMMSRIAPVAIRSGPECGTPERHACRNGRAGADAVAVGRLCDFGGGHGIGGCAVCGFEQVCVAHDVQLADVW